MKRTREDLASTRRVIGGGRGIGKLEPFVPRWEQCTAREVCLVPGLGTVLTATGRKGASIAHRPQATAPPGTLETGQVIGSSRDGLTKQLRFLGSMQTPQILKGKEPSE